jgi:transcriptional regulator with XRE-family HTH domain
MLAVVTDETVKNNVAANITRRLEARGWSQNELARRTGETAQRISNICRAVHEPGIATLARIAEALDLSVDMLLDDPPTPPRRRELRQTA